VETDFLRSGDGSNGKGPTPVWDSVIAFTQSQPVCQGAVLSHVTYGVRIVNSKPKGAMQANAV